MQITANTPNTTETDTETTTAFTMPGIGLRLEGLALFTAAVVLYAHLGYNGWLFLLLLFSFDLFMLGYLRGAKIGALVYNIGHSTVMPLLLGLAAFLLAWEPGLTFALIWAAHIGMDRVMGYGLKYASGFKHTHLNRV